MEDTTYRLRILHLSDLHQRVALRWMSDERRAVIRSRGAARRRVLDEGNFWEILAQIRTEQRVDLLCFTGDVADWGLAKEYKAASAWLGRVIGELALTRPRIFMVPGNHDVDRTLFRSAFVGLRELARRDPKGLSEWMAGGPRPFGAKAEWRNQILKRTSSFWKWVVRDVGLSHIDPRKSRHQQLGYHSALLIRDFPFPVHVFGLDSAWLAGDDNDSGKLHITQSQIDLLTRDENNDPYGGFRITLVHHPITDLADQDEAFRLLAATSDVVLHGHRHFPLYEVREDPDRNIRILAAGSLYEGDAGEHWINGFQVIDVELASLGQPLRYSVRFWSWSDRGHWFPGGNIYKSAPHGVLTLEMPEPDRSTKWSDIDEALRQGAVAGVPAGTDLEEFLWQKIPESRVEVEARNPGRKFREWKRKHGK